MRRKCQMCQKKAEREEKQRPRKIHLVVKLKPTQSAVSTVGQAQRDSRLGEVMRSVGSVGPSVLSLYSALFFFSLKPNIDAVKGPGRTASVWTPYWFIRQTF